MPSNGSLTAGMLGSLPIFRNTPRAQLAELARQGHAGHVPRGGTIARRGEGIEGLMAVGYGLVKLSLKGESEKVLRLVGPGETFGEAVLFLGQPLPVDVTAVAETLLIVVPAQPLLALLERDPAFARAMLASLCQRLHALVADFEATTMHGASERLAGYLESIAEPGPVPLRAQLPAAKTVIAARLGITKETLSRLLRGFVEQGLIRMAKREITIVDPARLAQAARGAPRA